MRIFSVFLLTFLGLSWGNAMDELIEGMKSGTWAELKTIGFTWENVHESKRSGSSSNIFAYTDDIVWDTKNNEMLFIGGGHYGAWRFVTYNAGANEWRERPYPLNLMGCPAGGNAPYCVGHAYDHNAIDVAGRYFYVISKKPGNVFRYHMDNQVWDKISKDPQGPYSQGMALAYFPEMGGLIRVKGGYVSFYDDQKKTWTVLKTNLPMGTHHNIAKYNPLKKVVLVGGGNTGERILHTLDSNGNFTRMKDAPCDIRPSRSIVAADPVTGHFRVACSSSDYFELDIVKNQWTHKGKLPFAFGGSRAANTPVGDKGVIFYLRAHDRKDGEVWIYKGADMLVATEAGASGPFSLQTLRITPSPFKEQVQIRLLGMAGSEGGQLEIFNVQGKQIFKKRISAGQAQKGIRWAPKNHSPGLYLFSLKLGTLKLRQKAILKF